MRKISEIIVRLSWNSKKKTKLMETHNFLDLNVKIQDSKLCDKPDNINFNIIRMSYKLNDIPHKMFYSAISADILRISKATTKILDFIKSAKILIRRMIKQGDQINHMNFFYSHKECFLKFGKTNNYILNKLL